MTDRYPHRLAGVDAPVDYDRRQRHLVIRPTLFERVSDALGSDKMFVFYAGFWSGAMFCCAMLILWAKVLS